MSKGPHSRLMSPDEPHGPGLFYISRRELPGSVAKDMRGGLDPLRGLPDRAGRTFRGSASCRHGLHFAVTCGDFTPVFRDGQAGEASLGVGDLAEIVDYDPVRRGIMAAGRGEPAAASPLHWFVYRCFPEMSAFLLLDRMEGAAPPPGVPSVPVTPVVWEPEVALEVMRHMKDSPVVALADGTVAAVGRDVRSASQGLVGAFGSGGLRSQ